MKKSKDNINRFDYYSMVAISYIGGWGAIILIPAGIWFSDYRWKLIFTGIFLILLNNLAENVIKKYREDTD